MLFPVCCICSQTSMAGNQTTTHQNSQPLDCLTSRDHHFLDEEAWLTWFPSTAPLQGWLSHNLLASFLLGRSLWKKCGTLHQNSLTSSIKFFFLFQVLKTLGRLAEETCNTNYNKQGCLQSEDLGMDPWSITHVDMLVWGNNDLVYIAMDIWCATLHNSVEQLLSFNILPH